MRETKNKEKKNLGEKKRGRRGEKVVREQTKKTVPRRDCETFEQVGQISRAEKAPGEVPCWNRKNGQKKAEEETGGKGRGFGVQGNLKSRKKNNTKKIAEKTETYLVRHLYPKEYKKSEGKGKGDDSQGSKESFTDKKVVPGTNKVTQVNMG